jgi:hypothetical protein
MKKLPGLTRPNLYDQHMGRIKGCFPERPDSQLDWSTPFQSSAGAELVRAAEQAERRGVTALKQILTAL